MHVSEWPDVTADRTKFFRDITGAVMRQPALIFDFGNVVGFFDYLKACERFGARLGVSGPAFRDAIVERGFAGMLARFESGRIGPREFAAEVMTAAGLELPYDEFVRDWEDIFWINEPVARLIAELKARGYPLLLGSNTNILHYEFYTRKFASTLDLLDHHILSHAVGELKPHPQFYATCVKAAGLPAAACVFIDDLEENVQGARSAGLLGVRYVDTPSLITDLRALGVDIAAAP
jgi:putative hydrolase of the HAD superfamily